MKFKVVSWNLNYWQNKKFKNEMEFTEWKKLIHETINGFNANIVLLQEINYNCLENIKDAILYHELPNMDWGSAIISKKYNATKKTFNSSYVGSEVLMYYDFLIDSDTKITIINIYGKGDYHGNNVYYNTTLHHMLSDVGPYIHRNNENIIILAGDFNATLQNEFANTAKYMDDKPLFDRIYDFGLVNCMDKLQQTHINKSNPNKP
jgi:endonuclease/exonuclease/phosphatase (EEP) superfamily protein YafD